MAVTSIPEGVTRVTVGGFTVGGGWGDPPTGSASTDDQTDTGPAQGQEASH